MLQWHGYPEAEQFPGPGASGWRGWLFRFGARRAARFIVLADPTNPTVQISLKTLNSAYHQDLAQVFAGTVIATAPLVIVFAVFFRQIISGIMEGAVKG